MLPTGERTDINEIGTASGLRRMPDASEASNVTRRDVPKSSITNAKVQATSAKDRQRQPNTALDQPTFRQQQAHTLGALNCLLLRAQVLLVSFPRDGAPQALHYADRARDLGEQYGLHRQRAKAQWFRGEALRSLGRWGEAYDAYVASAAAFGPAEMKDTVDGRLMECLRRSGRLSESGEHGTDRSERNQKTRLQAHLRMGKTNSDGRKVHFEVGDGE